MISKQAPDHIFELFNRHVRVSHGAFEKFSLYHDLLTAWQKKINLVGPDTVKDIWHRHFLDSLQLLNNIPDMSATIADIGSGAGFPGMVLAIAGAENMHLIERDAKKIAFLREVSRITETKVTIHHNALEDLSLLYPDIIIARACAPLGTLLDIISSQVSHGTICLFSKGKNWSKEVEDAIKSWSFDKAVISSITDDDGVILKLTHIMKMEPNDR